MSTDTSASASGRAWARAGFAFGAAGSLAGNVLAAWLPYGKGPGQHPGHAPIAQQAGSLVWPICLIVAVEVMSRIDWPDGVPWKLARFGGLGALAAGCAVISYGHIRHVLTAWDYGRFGSIAGAVVLDALMVMCGFAMLAASKSALKAATTLAVTGIPVPGAAAGPEGRSPTTLTAPPVHPETGSALTPPGAESQTWGGPAVGSALPAPDAVRELSGPPTAPPARPEDTTVEDTEDTGPEDTQGQARVYLTAVPEDRPAGVLAGRRARAAGTPSRARVAAPIAVPEDTDLVSQLRVLREDTGDALTTVRPVATALRIGKERARRVLELDAITPPAKGSQ